MSQMDPKVTHYLNKYLELEENKKRFVEMVEKVYPIVNVEEDLNKYNANNTNGIQLTLKSFEKWKKVLDLWLKNAKINKTHVFNEIESIKHIISSLVSIIQQEKNFDCISNVYRDVTGLQFTSESKIFLETDNISDQNQEHYIPFTVRHLEDSVDSLYEETHNKEEIFRLIDHFIHFVEEKIKICVINHNEVHKYGVDKKLIEGMEVSEEEPSVSSKSESISAKNGSEPKIGLNDSEKGSKSGAQTNVAKNGSTGAKNVGTGTTNGKQSGIISKITQIFYKKEDNKKT